MTTTQHRGYGGGLYLPNGDPMQVYRIAQTDAPAATTAIATSIPLDPNNPAQALQIAAGYHFIQSTNVWTPTTVVPQQTTGSGAGQRYNALGMTAANEVNAFVTAPSVHNNFQRSILISCWDAVGGGNRPVIFRTIYTSDRTKWVPSCTFLSFAALAWTIDSTHTVAPIMRSTHMWNSVLGDDRGGTISSPPVQLANLDLIQVMNGRMTVDVAAFGSAVKSSCVVMRSQDDGQTWDWLADLANGQALGVNVLESNIAKVHLNAGTEILRVMHRMGDNTRAYQDSSDGGATWGSLISLADAFPGGCSGRPSLLEMRDGYSPTGFTLFHMVRPVDFARDANIWASQDAGVTWRQRLYSPGTGTLPWCLGPSGQFTYGQFVNKQDRIGGVQDGIMGVFHSFATGSGTGVDAIGAESVCAFGEITLSRTNV